MKVFTTKYALSSGIREVEVEITSVPGMVATTNQAYKEYFHTEGKEWHRTLEAAQAVADKMRTKKIEGLKKSIAKLEKMTF